MGLTVTTGGMGLGVADVCTYAAAASAAVLGGSVALGPTPNACPPLRR